jgi:hypothetical protein
MTRIAISETEVYPEYRIGPVDPEILPAAGFEVEQSLIDEYNRAEAAWNAVQSTLGDLVRKREQ